MREMGDKQPHLLDELVKLTSIRDADLLECSLLRTLQEVLQPDELSLFRLNSADELCARLLCSASAGPQPMEEPTIAPRTLDLARHCDVDERPAPWARDDGLHISIFPILEARGIKTFLEVATRRAITSEEGRLINGFLRFLTNYCNLLDYSQRDQLTGLMNRKTFDDSIYKLFSSAPASLAADAEEAVEQERRARTRSGKHWLGMLDIDHFKRINDGFGHLYGDEVLLLVSQVMQRTFRENDLLFRFGGEEFVVITRNESREGAETAFNRLREAIAGYPFPQVGKVTASIGVVQLVPGHLTPILLDKADRALYWAKQNGRNRVAVFEDLLARGEVSSNEMPTTEVDLF